MVTISLIPILGVISLIAVALAAVSWRGARLARVTQSVDEAATTILQKDLENDQQLVSNLLSGTPIDECFVQHADIRRRLLPSAGEGHWTIDDLTLWKKFRKNNEAESINRRMLVPTFGVVLAIITLCVVFVVLLYEFQVSAPTIVDELAADSIAIPSPTELENSAVPVVVNDALPVATKSNPSPGLPPLVIQPNPPAAESDMAGSDPPIGNAPESASPNPNSREPPITKSIK